MPLTLEDIKRCREVLRSRRPIRIPPLYYLHPAEVGSHRELLVKVFGDNRPELYNRDTFVRAIKKGGFMSLGYELALYPAREEGERR